MPSLMRCTRHGKKEGGEQMDHEEPTLCGLTVSQFGITARAVDIHRQMLARQVTHAEGWKKDELLGQIEDLQQASDVLKQREQELLNNG